MNFLGFVREQGARNVVRKSQGYAAPQPIRQDVNPFVPTVIQGSIQREQRQQRSPFQPLGERVLDRKITFADFCLGLNDGVVTRSRRYFDDHQAGPGYLEEKLTDLLLAFEVANEDEPTTGKSFAETLDDVVTWIEKTRS